MNADEVRKAFNEFVNLYPNQFNSYTHQQKAEIARSWEKLYEKVTDCEAFIEGMYDLKRSSNSIQPPSARDLLDAYRTAKARMDYRSGRGGKRIITDDESRYQIYLQEMKKEPDKRDERLIQMCLPSAEIMCNKEAYIQKYGKPREEYERL